MNSCILLIILSVVQRSFAVIYQLDDEEHDLMPPTIALDPFAKCLRRPGGRYCTAYVSYVSDSASPLLTQMQEYSEHASLHFNHTRALVGTCLSQKCKDIVGNTADPRTYLEQCLNRTAWDKYKLRVKVDEEIFCNDHGEKKPDVGTAGVVVAATFLFLVVCNLIGSLVDIYCPKQNGPVSRFLQCFSIPRNWKILTAPVGASDPRLERLKGIHGIRAISMIGVITLHGLIPGIMVTENSKFIEDLYESTPFHVLINGTLIMQTFLFLSGFLLVYSCQLYAETTAITWKTLPTGILKRWLRLTPPYVVMLALTATWFPRFNTGPIWGLLVVSESESCSRDWWQHVFYFNNYYQSMCMPHTWYLATDMQLYCVGLAIFVCCQAPRARRVVLAALFIAGMVTPALLTYYLDLDGPLLALPKVDIAELRSNRTLNAVYKPAYTNVPCYVMGLAAGYLVHWLQRYNFDAAKYKTWRPLYWLAFPLAVAITMTCKVFYSNPRVGLLYRVAAAAFLKPMFGLLMALIIVGMIFKIETLYRGVLEWDGWVSLSRVSYSANLVHLGYVHVTSGAIDRPLTASHLRSNEMVLFTITMVFTIAYIFWLTVEAPLTQIVKNYFLHSPAGKKNISEKAQ